MISLKRRLVHLGPEWRWVFDFIAMGFETFVIDTRHWNPQLMEDWERERRAACQCRNHIRWLISTQFFAAKQFVSNAFSWALIFASVFVLNNPADNHDPLWGWSINIDRLPSGRKLQSSIVWNPMMTLIHFTSWLFLSRINSLTIMVAQNISELLKISSSSKSLIRLVSALAWLLLLFYSMVNCPARHYNL